MYLVAKSIRYLFWPRTTRILAYARLVVRGRDLRSEPNCVIKYQQFGNVIKTINRFNL